MKVLPRRQAGILLHHTSLPGPYGIGDLGPSSVAFLEWLNAAGQSVWQVLPLGPTGYGDSPYGALSDRAGNPLLISPEWLRDEGLIDGKAVFEGDPSGPVDYRAVGAFKEKLLRAAHGRLSALPPQDSRVRQIEQVLAREGPWLDDWCLFAALKAHFGGRSWIDWEEGLRKRLPAALAKARRHLADEIAFHRTCQGLFALHWQRLRSEATARGISVLGDLPIYPAHDSVDVWAHQDLFELDSKGRPTAVSGVPPDDFSDDGQLWGGPLYRWDVMKRRNYRWWIERIAVALERFDLLRLDHFRGFEAFWSVPNGAQTAAEGQWLPGPGGNLFEAVRGALGELPLIAEDLGVITPAVEELRDSLGFPGMRVLQFAFDEPESLHLPHAAPLQSVAYTGTHDNDAAIGWYKNSSSERRQAARQYLGPEAEGSIAWAMLRAIHTSPAALAIAPLQDVLELDSEARMNTPGSSRGNWTWRLGQSALSNEAAQKAGLRLSELTEASQRLPKTKG